MLPSISSPYSTTITLAFLVKEYLSRKKVSVCSADGSFSPLQIYDIVIGDITIRYNRTFYADFTLPYTESGIAMVVPVRDSRNKNTWIFLKPLAPGMWFGSIVFFIYTGVVVLILEFLGNNENVRGPIPRQLGIMIFFSIFEES